MAMIGTRPIPTTGTMVITATGMKDIIGDTCTITTGTENITGIGIMALTGIGPTEINMTGLGPISVTEINTNGMEHNSGTSTEKIGTEREDKTLVSTSHYSTVHIPNDPRNPTGFVAQ